MSKRSGIGAWEEEKAEGGGQADAEKKSGVAREWRSKISGIGSSRMWGIQRGWEADDEVMTQYDVGDPALGVHRSVQSHILAAMLATTVCTAYTGPAIRQGPS
ncbi:hypothetical protein C8J57DRAFT_1237184 [Mycena rebaudengoi]|nr:hypothetical protein C8J57DRAFT_1237184 [Mycena rebaudengoi]